MDDEERESVVEGVVPLPDSIGGGFNGGDVHRHGGGDEKERLREREREVSCLLKKEGKVTWESESA